MLRSIVLGSCLSLAIASLITPTIKAEESIVISRLKVREGTLIVSKDAGKIKYSLVNTEGESVVKNISEAQLIAQYPDLYDRFRSGIADSEVSPWAGMLDY